MYKKSTPSVIAKSTKTTIKECSLCRLYNKLQFNTKCQLSTTGGQLSSESGLVLVKEFMEKIQFDHLIQETVPFNDPRKYCIHEQSQLFQQLLF
ncbi:MAG: hypothetical protein GX180_12960 [Enterococcus sp.]|nr:hypothetical protein [Enterococcus sp.]